VAASCCPFPSWDWLCPSSDRKGTLTYAAHPTFKGADFYERDIDAVLEELRKAAR
jgi:hypothetical protein